MRFSDRRQAGELLAEKLTSVRSNSAIVVGLARGGVVVAAALARKLGLPLDVLVVKKIPSPADSEMAIGALAPDNVTRVDWKLAHLVGADECFINEQIARLNEEVKKRTLLYRKGVGPLVVRNKTVIAVDDGVATGSTIESAILWFKKKHADTIIVALPVVPSELVAKIKPEVDSLVTLEEPERLSAVGEFYQHFPQVTDAEVIELLKKNT